MSLGIVVVFGEGVIEVGSGTGHEVVHAGVHICVRPFIHLCVHTCVCPCKSVRV